MFLEGGAQDFQSRDLGSNLGYIWLYNFGYPLFSGPHFFSFTKWR